jgi:uncharacterized protein (DUF427 family)
MTDTVTNRGRVHAEPGQKRVRAYVGGHLVADTTKPLLVWESPYYPAYYVPTEDVRAELVPTGNVQRSPSRGEATLYTVRLPDRELVDAARIHHDSPIEEIRDHVRLDWGAIDTWFEEDDEVFVHPRNPYTRVDILASSRHVVVKAGETVLAESDRPFVLFETHLPPRYYLPKVDVRMDLLQPTDTVTHCPYKGTAQYWSAVIGDQVIEDVAWSYPTPLPESLRAAGLISFYGDKVDIEVTTP